MAETERQDHNGDDDDNGDDGDRRAERVEQRFAGPVVVAAVASIPATFLTTMDGAAETAGRTINYLSLSVLVGESMIPFLLARHHVRWLRKRWYLVVITGISIPAVIFAVGPAQLLRLVRYVGALRVLRVRRILKAGRILRQKAGGSGWQWKLLSVTLSLLAAGFVAVVLADPTSQTRQLAEDVFGRFDLPAAIAAGLIVAVATFLVLRNTRKSEE